MAVHGSKQTKQGGRYAKGLFLKCLKHLFQRVDASWPGHVTSPSLEELSFTPPEALSRIGTELPKSYA